MICCHDSFFFQAEREEEKKEMENHRFTTASRGEDSEGALSSDAAGIYRRTITTIKQLRRDEERVNKLHPANSLENMNAGRRVCERDKNRAP